MKSLLLIRHAQARDRRTWRRDDRERPLTARGLRQSEALRRSLRGEPITSIRSSPAARCSQTVAPLAMELGIPIHLDEDLFEGRVITLRPWRGTLVLCAHGDNIPQLLESLKIEAAECGKGSVWRLVFRGATVTEASYSGSPD